MDFHALMAHIPEERKQELNLGMFKAYDIRTKSHRLSTAIAQRLILATGRYILDELGTGSVVLGRDARLAGPGLVELAIEMFPAMGISVIVNPLQSSTCQFYFACMRNPGSAGIMFTASHNPGEYIGLKLMGPGMTTLAMDSGPGGGITGILARYLEDAQPGAMPHNVHAKAPRAAVRVQRYLDEFIDYSIRLAGIRQNSLAGVPILADFLNGAAGTEMSEALGFAGASLRVRNLVPDGFFPSGDPNPIVVKSIQPTRELMRSGNFLCGFCFDGDGDRMDVMAPSGDQLAPGFNMTVLVPEIVKYFASVHAMGGFGPAAGPYAPHIYADVKANPMAMADQAAAGAKVHIIRNGHSFIKEALRSNFSRQYLAASEESAHYYMNFPMDPDDVSKGFAGTENTLYFMLLTAKMWAAEPARYEAALARQHKIVREREWPCHFHDESLMENVMDEVESEFARRGLVVMKTMEDGGSLDATLMRSGLPEVIGPDTDLEKPWFQVAQRITRSEEGITRWEVVSNSETACRDAVAAIRRISDRYIEKGQAEYL
jgi:phosphomannomutase